MKFVMIVDNESEEISLHPPVLESVSCWVIHQEEAETDRPDRSRHMLSFSSRIVQSLFKEITKSQSQPSLCFRDWNNLVYSLKTSIPYFPNVGLFSRAENEKLQSITSYVRALFYLTNPVTVWLRTFRITTENAALAAFPIYTQSLSMCFISKCFR